MSGIRALVVDDEKPARARLAELLARSPHIAEIQECANGRDAVMCIHEAAPDLVFLDVQMPELDGFGVLREPGPARAPVVVFVTAYDQFAIQAFESQALDYLLKPFSDERFERCLDRAVEQVRLRERRKPAEAFLHRLAIRSAGRTLFLNVDEIVWIEAAGVYVELHTAAKTHLHRATLSELEAQLDPARFVRIHRSAIVSRARVRELHPQSHGDAVVILDDGTELKLSRNYRERVEAR